MSGRRATLPARFLALRLACRELRAGPRGFGIFLACIALGVAAIAGVGSSAESLREGLSREGRVILGGDVVLSLVHREADDRERAFLQSQGRVSVGATMRAMARTEDGRAVLTEVKAVDGAWPLYGTAALEPAGDLAAALAERDGVHGAAADPTLLARLDLPVGARLRVGDATLVVRAALASEPDKLGGGLAFGPRLLVSEAALRASGLLVPGSLVRWSYRLRLSGADDEQAAEGVAAEARRQFPDAGWEVRTRRNASPELGRNIGRFSQFLGLVGLTSLLVGGVGVANAVRSYLDRKRDIIAVLKALGATGTRVFAIYLTQVLILAGAGVLIGLAIGAAIPFAVVALLGHAIPVPMAASVHLNALLPAVLYGILTALAFALWPLGRAHDIPVSALFRDEIAPRRLLPRLRYVLASGGAVAVLAIVAVVLAYDRWIAATFIAAAAVVFVALRAIAMLLMLAARRAPRPRSSLFRLVLADIHRPGALTATIVLSLGIGLTLLVALSQIDGNLRREFVSGLPERAPSFYFIDIQRSDAQKFEAFVHAQAPGARLDRVPMLRGRLVSAHGVKAEDLHPPANIAWVLNSDRGITDAAAVPSGSRVVAGTWWGPDYDGPPLVSVENRIAEGLGLKLGDPVTVNVLGRNITATVSNLRAVDWETLGINFVLVFSPRTFRGAPHADIATLTYPDGGTPAGEAALVRSAAESFPAVTTIRVKDVLEAVGRLVRNLMLGVRAAGGVTLLAAVLVLAGALATGHRHRVYDAVVLKVLGASRLRLLALYALEYLMLGVATAVLGVLAGSIGAALVVTGVMDTGFVWQPGPAFAVAFGALAVTVGLGLVGTLAALSRRPGAVLRHL